VPVDVPVAVPVSVPVPVIVEVPVAVFAEEPVPLPVVVAVPVSVAVPVTVVVQVPVPVLVDGGKKNGDFFFLPQPLNTTASVVTRQTVRRYRLSPDIISSFPDLNFIKEVYHILAEFSRLAEKFFTC